MNRLAILAVVALFLSACCTDFSRNDRAPRAYLDYSGRDDKGRYQISAWAVQAEATKVHSGYYVLDTATGQIVASKSESPRLKE